MFPSVEDSMSKWIKTLFKTITKEYNWKDTDYQIPEPIRGCVGLCGSFVDLSRSLKS